VTVFTSQVLAATQLSPVTAYGPYWFAQPKDCPAAELIRAPVIPRLDRVLVHVSGDSRAAVAMLTTELLSNASLLLAPTLREMIEDVIGWPVLAVAPDRDFVYMWNRPPRPDHWQGRRRVPRARPCALPAVD
jgi:hypothetical protein